MVNNNWGGAIEDNSFGTHEFLNLCELLGCEPYISANVGSGTVEEMAKWVEYMTSEGTVRWPVYVARMVVTRHGTINDHNTFEKPELVKPTVFNGAKVEKGQLKITLPAQSIVVLEVK